MELIEGKPKRETVDMILAVQETRARTRPTNQECTG